MAIMRYFVNLIIYLSFVMGLFVVGCNKKEQPIWEKVKISDLADSTAQGKKQVKMLKAVNLDVYIFEIPAMNIRKLNKLWQILTPQPIKFNSYDAFTKNGFRIGFGRLKALKTASDLLILANSKRVYTNSTVFFSKQSSDLVVRIVGRRNTIRFISSGGFAEKVTVDPGRMVLRLSAERIPGARGVCNLLVRPVFTNLQRNAIPRMNQWLKQQEFYFPPITFSVKLSPGDFVLLMPQKYTSDTSELAGLFCNQYGSVFLNSDKIANPDKPVSMQRKPAVRLLMFVCTAIRD